MRILFITPYLPSLIRVRPYNFLKQLSKRHDITLVSLAQDGPPDVKALAELRRYCSEVHVIPLSKTSSFFRCCRGLLTRMPLQAAYTDLAYARNFVTDKCENGDFDLIHVEHIRGTPLTSGISHIRTPKVYDSVDCITRLLKKRLADKCNAFQRVLNLEELLKMRFYEPAVASAFDRVVITSERDKRVLQWLMLHFADRRAVGYLNTPATAPAGSLAQYAQDGGVSGGNGSAGVSVVPNGVDSDYFHPMPATINPSEIVFSGKMAYFPNTVAVHEFYRDVFPRIRQQRPNVTFKIVGSNPPESVRKLAKDPAVTVTGYVDDMRPHLASAAVIVCPLSIGVGVQNKVLEAMAMGKPIVASSTALGGIRGVVDGLHLIRADGAEHVAERVLSLLRSPEVGLTIGENARRFAVRSYSWDAAARSLEEAYESAVDMHESRASVAA